MVHCYVTETKVNAKLKTADSAVAPLQTTAGVLHQLIVQKPLDRESGSKVLSKRGKLWPMTGDDWPGAHLTPGVPRHYISLCQSFRFLSQYCNCEKRGSEGDFRIGDEL